MDRVKIEKLITQALLGEISEDEQRLLNEWLNESEENNDFFQNVQSAKYLSKAISDENLTLLTKEWENLRKETVAAKERRLYRYILKATAVVILPLMVGSIIWYFLRPVENIEAVSQENIGVTDGYYKALVTLSNGEKIIFSPDTTISAGDALGILENHKDTLRFVPNNSSSGDNKSRRIIQIPRGAEYIVRLEDGTVVYLNAESELQVAGDFGQGKREVWLTGEAYFKVQHDKERLFTVKTDKADISVLGTEFSIRAYNGEQITQTTLVNGSVEVKSGHVVKVIVPGQQACVSQTGDMSIQQVDVHEYTAWKDGRIVFVNTRLEDILRDLQRLYDFEITYRAPQKKELRFTIDIAKYGKVSEIFNLIQDIQDVKFEINGKNVVLE